MSYYADLLRVIHLLTSILMAWPAYALVAVNQRGRLGPPLGDRADVYMENIIKNRTIPCFVFQITVFLSGLAMVHEIWGLSELFTNGILFLKFSLLILVIGLLLYVYVIIQPKIDDLFAESNPVPDDVVPRINTLRLLRKRLATVCMFVVLTEAIMGVQVLRPFPQWNGLPLLTIFLLLAITAFTYRAYHSVTPYGWV